MKEFVTGFLSFFRLICEILIIIKGEPYTFSTPLTPDDSHLIIACDGVSRSLLSSSKLTCLQVWDVLEDQAACDIVLNEPTLKRKAERLVGHSLKVQGSSALFLLPHTLF